MLLHVVTASGVIGLASTLVCIPDVVNANVGLGRKAAACLARFVHDWIVLFAFMCIGWLLFAALWLGRYDRDLLLVFNVVMFVFAFQFCIFHMCILTIVYNTALGRTRCIPYPGLFVGIDQNGSSAVLESTCGERNMKLWLNGNTFTFSMGALLNLLFLLH
jgi:hypothetical protein